MKRAGRRVFLAEEARTALALLQAAEEEGMLLQSELEAWRDIANRPAAVESEPSARSAACHLIRKVADRPQMRDHWIGRRWHQIDRAAS